jgi:hypothetical protein
MKLEDAITLARQDSFTWTRERSARVLASAKRTRTARERRERAVWRGLAIASVAAALLALGRITVQPVDAPESVAPPPAAASLAVLDNADAGQGRD